MSDIQKPPRAIGVQPASDSGFFQAAPPQQGPPPPPIIPVQGVEIVTPSAFLPPPLQKGYSQPLFKCGDDTKICLDEVLHPYCHIGYMYRWLDDRSQDMSGFACCGTCLVDLLLCAGMARCSVIAHMRQRLAILYNIEEHGCRTIMTSFCCSCCAMCQQHREMVMRGCFTGGLCYKPPTNVPFASPAMSVPTLSRASGNPRLR